MEVGRVSWAEISLCKGPDMEESMVTSGNWHEMEEWFRGMARGKVEEAVKGQVLMGLECRVREPQESLSREASWSDFSAPPTPAQALWPLLLTCRKLLPTPRLLSNLSTGSEFVNFFTQADLSPLICLWQMPRMPPIWGRAENPRI